MVNKTSEWTNGATSTLVSFFSCDSTPPAHLLFVSLHPFTFILSSSWFHPPQCKGWGGRCSDTAFFNPQAATLSPYLYIRPLNYSLRYKYAQHTHIERRTYCGDERNTRNRQKDDLNRSEYLRCWSFVIIWIHNELSHSLHFVMFSHVTTTDCKVLKGAVLCKINFVEHYIMLCYSLTTNIRGVLPWSFHACLINPLIFCGNHSAA